MSPHYSVGRVTFELENEDVRAIRVDGVEVARRIHVAVRDGAWGTIAPTLSDIDVSVGSDEVTTRFQSRHVGAELEFTWTGTIVVRGDGTLTYEMDGVAERDFAYCRIGIIVLHPPGCAGRPIVAVDDAGERKEALPDLIGPQWRREGVLVPCVQPYRRLSIDHPEGIRSVFAFEGDLFEMEDQRNWTDASFKTYSTPLALGFPHQAKSGQRIVQRLHLTVEGRPSARASSDAPQLSLGASSGRGLPPLGSGLPTEDPGLDEREVAVLRRLALQHVRVDVDARDAAAGGDRLDAARHAASQLGCAIELAVHAPEPYDDSLKAVAGLLRADDPVARVLAFDPDREASGIEIVSAARDALGLQDTPHMGGTDGYGFVDLNRQRPRLDGCDGVAYSINPQVHAYDDRTVIENIRAQSDTVRTARSFTDIPIVVSPVTLRPRSVPWTLDRPLPDPVDERQPLLLAAAWTVGSIQELALAGAASVTYFELAGWRGLIDRTNGSPMPEHFPSRPGMIFPVFHVFAAIGSMRAGTLRAVEGLRPDELAGFAVEDDNVTRIVVANLLPEPAPVRLGVTGHTHVAILDEAALADATQNEAWLETAFGHMHGAALDLGAYAVAFVDVEP